MGLVRFTSSAALISSSFPISVWYLSRGCVSRLVVCLTIFNCLMLKICCGGTTPMHRRRYDRAYPFVWSRSCPDDYSCLGVQVATQVTRIGCGWLHFFQCTPSFRRCVRWEAKACNMVECSR